MLAQMGNSGIDLLNNDIEDGFKDIAKLKDMLIYLEIQA